MLLQTPQIALPRRCVRHEASCQARTSPFSSSGRRQARSIHTAVDWARAKAGCQAICRSSPMRTTTSSSLRRAFSAKCVQTATSFLTSRWVSTGPAIFPSMPFVSCSRSCSSRQSSRQIPRYACRLVELGALRASSGATATRATSRAAYLAAPSEAAANDSGLQARPGVQLLPYVYRYVPAYRMSTYCTGPCSRTLAYVFSVRRTIPYCGCGAVETPLTARSA